MGRPQPAARFPLAEHGFPPAKVLDKLLADMRKKNPKATLDDVKKPFGASDREMLADVNATVGNLKMHFPDYAGQGYEFAGFIWFQGWNDMINADHTAEYPANLTHFIKDIRKDLKAPKLPFVIGQMGVDGVKAGGNVKKFKATQAAVLDVAEFKGNVALVKTDVFWDTDAEAVFKKGCARTSPNGTKSAAITPTTISAARKPCCKSAERSAKPSWSYAARRSNRFDLALHSQTISRYKPPVSTRGLVPRRESHVATFYRPHFVVRCVGLGQRR